MWSAPRLLIGGGDARPSLAPALTGGGRWGVVRQARDAIRCRPAASPSEKVKGLLADCGRRRGGGFTVRRPVCLS